MLLEPDHTPVFDIYPWTINCFMYPYQPINQMLMIETVIMHLLLVCKFTGANETVLGFVGQNGAGKSTTMFPAADSCIQLAICKNGTVPLTSQQGTVLFLLGARNVI